MTKPAPDRVTLARVDLPFFHLVELFVRLYFAATLAGIVVGLFWTALACVAVLCLAVAGVLL